MDKRIQLYSKKELHDITRDKIQIIKDLYNQIEKLKDDLKIMTELRNDAVDNANKIRTKYEFQRMRTEVLKKAMITLENYFNDMMDNQIKELKNLSNC